MLSRRSGRWTHGGVITIGEEPFPCKGAHMSAAGAVLTFSGPVDLPARFTLALTPLGHVLRECTMNWDTMNWEEGEQIGVVFGEAML
jgi:hypothetical protein